MKIVFILPRSGNYAIHAERDWLFFFKSKAYFTRNCAGTYAIHAERDWLFFKSKPSLTPKPAGNYGIHA